MWHVGGAVGGASRLGLGASGSRLTCGEVGRGMRLPYLQEFLIEA